MVWRQRPRASVIQICWIAPDPSMSASVNVSPGWMITNGETFQPWPRSRAICAAGPSVDMPPLPFSPLKFSGEIERDLALESLARLPRLRPRPLKSAIQRLRLCLQKAAGGERAHQRAGAEGPGRGLGGKADLVDERAEFVRGDPHHVARQVGEALARSAPIGGRHVHRAEEQHEAVRVLMLGSAGRSDQLQRIAADA